MLFGILMYAAVIGTTASVMALTFGIEEIIDINTNKDENLVNSKLESLEKMGEWL